MPLFSNQQNQNPAVWEPQAADSRLAKTAGASPAGVFTSDLSVSEYVLLGVTVEVKNHVWGEHATEFPGHRHSGPAARR